MPIWVFAGVYLTWRVILHILNFWKKHKKVVAKNDGYLQSCLDNDNFRDYWLDRIEHKPYVDIDYQLNSPAEYEEPNKPSGNVERYSLKNTFVKDFFNPSHRGSKYAAILGDSGSGKTTALVNLLIDYVNHSNAISQPYDIQIFSMGNKDVWEKIDKYFEGKEEEKYILLLDGHELCHQRR